MLPPGEDAFRAIFRAAHADHATCHEDEWLHAPCRAPDGTPLPPLVWSRRNGPWHPVPVVFVGAAPGNAGGRGRGPLGAHGTRIPFGGDVAGANLEVLLGSVGLHRNGVFLVAAYNRLPARGGGEPTAAEILAPVGRYPSSVALLRDTLLACQPRLIVALGNVALRALAAAGAALPRLPTLGHLAAAGLTRGRLTPWPPAFQDAAFRRSWAARTDAPLPPWLWLYHPSAQTMSPLAAPHTAFVARMRATRDALRAAVATALPEHPLPDVRPLPPSDGIYVLPEWRERIAPRLAALDARWRALGL
jgi:uracil-DNA glycosylase